MSIKSRVILPLALVGAIAYGLSTEKDREFTGESESPTVVVETSKEEYAPSKGMEVENDFGYEASDIWYNRKNALEALASRDDSTQINSETITDLSVIALGDGHPINARLANSMIKSYEENGDFSDTEPYQRRLAGEQRLTIKTSNDFGYKPSDIWYNRKNALEALSGNPNAINESVTEDLRTIAQKDDDWRIRELAGNIIKSYEESQ